MSWHKKQWLTALGAAAGVAGAAFTGGGSLMALLPEAMGGAAAGGAGIGAGTAAGVTAADAAATGATAAAVPGMASAAPGVAGAFGPQAGSLGASLATGAQATPMMTMPEGLMGTPLAEQAFTGGSAASSFTAPASQGAQNALAYDPTARSSMLQQLMSRTQGDNFKKGMDTMQAMKLMSPQQPQQAGGGGGAPPSMRGGTQGPSAASSMQSIFGATPDEEQRRKMLAQLMAQQRGFA